MRLLSAASECAPFFKRGGLGDAVSGLATALARQDVYVTVVIPAFRDVLTVSTPVRVVATTVVACMPVRVLELAHKDHAVWLVDIPACFDRDGGAYESSPGVPWPDDARRFSAFSDVVAMLAGGGVEGVPRFDVVHCHDWHTGLVPVWLYLRRLPVPVLFTVHNGLYQGNFPFSAFRDLGLPLLWWSPTYLEFHGRVSFLKAGLVFADRLSTVSPRHVTELCHGWEAGGLDGVFRQRRRVFSGILNGIDRERWNPFHDPHVSPSYDRDSVERKAIVRTRLRQALGLADDPSIPLIAVISRLVWQKGMDLLPRVIERLPPGRVQWVIIGTGDAGIEEAIAAHARIRQDDVRFLCRFDEPLAHRLLAAADLFFMPSRYEPCGLAHLQAMRYGAVPLVSAVGGLSDTVIDEHAPEGNGVVFSWGHDGDELHVIMAAVMRMLILWDDQPRFRHVRDMAMKACFEWSAAARQYKQVLSSLIIQHQPPEGDEATCTTSSH
jgi:starch synthase